MGTSHSRQKDQNMKLIHGIEEGNLMKVLKAIKKGANIKGTIQMGRRPTREPRIPTLTSVVLPDWSALMIACYLGHNHLVQILLQQGADLSLKALDGTTALMLAAQEGHVHVVEELLKHVQKKREGAQIPPLLPPHDPLNLLKRKSPLPTRDPSPSMTGPPTSFSSSFTSFLSGDVLQPVVPRSASNFDPILDAVDDKGRTALLRASALGYSPIVELLVYAGANVCVADQIDGMTALSWASEHGPSEIVLLLIHAGANINRKNYNGQTPLLIACSKDYDYNLVSQMEERHISGPYHPSHDDTVRIDMEESKSVQMIPSASSSSSSCAFSRITWGPTSSSPSSVVLTLLSNGADMNATNHDKYSPLMVASWKGHSSVVELLLTFKANLNARAEKGQTALMIATAQLHSRIAELIITAGAQLNIVDEKGESALHKASLAGDRFTAECLIAAGADINLKEHIHGNTPLLLASRQMHSSIVELLVKHPSCKIDMANHRNVTALMLACSRGHLFTASVLVRYGANLNATDSGGNTPLHYAARSGSEPLVELLLDVGALLTKNHADDGPLHFALEAATSLTPTTSSHQSVIELLVAAGADPVDACVHLHLSPSPSSSIGSSSSSVASDSIFLALPPPIAAAIERGFAGRERYEKRENKHLELLQSLKSRSTSSDFLTPSLTPLNANNSNGPTSLSLPPSTNISAAMTSTPLVSGHQSSNSFAIPASSTTTTSVAAVSSSAQPSAQTIPDAQSWDVSKMLALLQTLSSQPQALAEAGVNSEMLVQFMKSQINNGSRSNTTTSSSSSTTSSSSVPLVSSISNPLPAATNVNTDGVYTRHMHSISNGVGAAAANSSALPTATSSARLFPTPVASTASLGPTIDIFSSQFDFNDLSKLAPLSASTSASLTSNSAKSNGSSLNVSPSGSAESMGMNGRLPHQTPLLHSNGVSLLNSSALTQEYDHMNSSDLISKSEPRTEMNGGLGVISLAPVTIPSNGHGSNSSMDQSNPIANSNHINSEPVSPSSIHLVKRVAAPPARRIPYTELQFKEVIGSGQFGTVYLGSWRGVPVAIKKLHLRSDALLTSNGPSTAAPSSSIESEQIQLFLQEAALMEMLGNHPNLITFLGICLPDNYDSSASGSSTSATSPATSSAVLNNDICIITQYFPLGSIRDLLITKKTFSRIPPNVLAAASSPVNSLSASNQRPFNLLTLLHMCRDIACGVMHLHLDHIIHRDIAARNCLVDEFSLSVRVADFGLSRFLAQHQLQDSAYTNTHLGPLKHFAPECVLSHSYSTKSDAYAFGITMWEILAAADPYPNHLPLEAAIGASHSETFRPQIPTDLPASLTSLMTQCWHHQPDARPEFKEILARLETIIKEVKGNQS